MRRSAGVLVAVGVLSCGRAASDGSRLLPAQIWEQPVAEDDGTLFHSFGGLPESTLSVTVTVEGGVPGDILSFGLRDRAGRVLTASFGPEESPNRALSGRAPAVAMLPSATTSLPLGPEYNWQGRRRSVDGEGPPLEGVPPLRFSAFVKLAANDVRFDAVRRAPALQALDTALVLVGDRVAEDDRLDRALVEMGRVLRAAGLEVGEPERRRLSGIEYERFERLSIDPALGSDSPELGDLLRIGTTDGDAEEPPQRLVIYVVYDITVQGSSILGIAGGIPVPPVPRTGRSGIAINALVIEQDPLRGGQVMAHEIGHALGLYHTTEADGVHADTIADTTGSADDNLMRWDERKGAAHLTAGQSEILRRAALAR